MTYREFINWCNHRAMDGIWSKEEALLCLTILSHINSVPFWKKSKTWKFYEPSIVERVVSPINRRLGQ